VYEHLLRLDLSFHLTRQTGGLTRAIDRGTKGISFLLTSMVFHILPTALEISLVCGILVCAVQVWTHHLTNRARHTNMAGNLP
jgi:ABC-type transport system involved in Fe-S cluster assembly fused permease/ATPase subunit